MKYQFIMVYITFSRIWLSVWVGAESGWNSQEAIQQVEDANQGRNQTNHWSTASWRVHCKRGLYLIAISYSLNWILSNNYSVVFLSQENSKHWTMKLDICAPQVIFPDDFQSEDPMLVVVDLGRILLTNSQGNWFWSNQIFWFSLSIHSEFIAVDGNLWQFYLSSHRRS